MKRTNPKIETILVSGNDKMAVSITVCLLKAGYKVFLYTDDKEEALKSIQQHASDIASISSVALDLVYLEIGTELEKRDYSWAIAITEEDLNGKMYAIREIERAIPDAALIAINTETIPLTDIQNGSRHPERILGANWVEPAHTTYFLEVITNSVNRHELVMDFCSAARQHLQKDPYIVKSGCGSRAKVMGALIREAFYLVENGYVTFEDVDRACRNDAGYYLPFAGNFRYMDLMGTYIYGLVMKEMNPDLSKERYLPGFFKDIVAGGGEGMKNLKGFYEYKNGDVEEWNKLSRTFSYQVNKIISKYPFNYLEEDL